MIKIELNYSLRAHLFEPMTRTFATDAFGTGSTVITVHPMEIFAAKANALLSRSAARDLYLLTNTELINVFTGYVQTLDLFYMPSIC